jgi:hypothetical protein
MENTLRHMLCSLSALALLALAGIEPGAAAQVDFSISKIEVNQAVQTGTTPLVGGRSTFARVSVRVTNPPVTPPLVDGLLRVYVDGVEAAWSPVFSDNGPFPAKSPIDPTQEDGTLNFIFLAPTSGNVVLTAEVNPAGPNFVAEVNSANNLFTSATLGFQELGVPELAYVPIDYRPTGGAIPNLPDAAQIEPGMGDNFVQGIYPSRDWYYHRTDAPSKLWTSSLASSGSPLLSALQVDINLMVPQPDFLYGFVPGGLPYNGQSFLPGNVSMGNTELIRYQRTLAHEMGHNTGLQHNTLSIGVVGVDVEHHLNLTQGLPQIKQASLKDIMYAGLLTQEAWVAPVNYNHFINHPVFDPPSLAATAGSSVPRFMIAGVWNRATGAIELSDVLTLPAGKLTAPAAPGSANLVVRAWAGGTLLVELPILALTSADTCEACRAPGAEAPDAEPASLATPDSDGATPPVAAAGGASDAQGADETLVPFSAVLPLPAEGQAPIDRLVVAPASGTRATALEVRRSASAPQVAFTSPVSGAVPAAQLSVAWDASDADGDALRYYLSYSPDGGKRFVPLATGLDVTQVDVDLSVLPALAAGKGFFELLASDGLNVTRVRTQPLTGSFAALGTGNPPWVELVTPDNGTSFRYGATIVLHSSGWDLEDRGLEGDSIQWSSDVDGPLASGRLTSVTDLSVGPHVLTVQATDGDGLVTIDTASITVLARDLPTTGGVTCQADLGFGGPGGAELALCGGDLSTGTSADLELVNGPAFAQAFLVAGFTNAPTPLKGGQLVPFPWTLFVPVATDGSGSLSIPAIQGGGGPVSVFLQCILADGSQAQGFGFSNALQVDLLP